MSVTRLEDLILKPLNPQQQEAVTHGADPLLIVAGAGTGKTATIVHRVAWLVAHNVPPHTIMLLTFTRRAAEEMVRRVEAILSRLSGAQPAGYLATRIWGGTFHAIGLRFLRLFGEELGLPPGFTVLDRSDAEDFLNVIRTDLKLATTDRRFPKKGTCADIYSRMVNTGLPLRQVLAEFFPWCKEWHDELDRLFREYTARKKESATLDYDDLLLAWLELLSKDSVGSEIRKRFRAILVDEYQDTNIIQANILYRLSPTGDGVTVVGDDAQAIYSFRGASVKNILEFPKQYPNARIVTLEQNYRSTMPILRAANAIIRPAKEKFTKNLWSEKKTGEKPWLVAALDEYEQAEFVIRRILEHHNQGTLLRHQAVLFRASHHSLPLEAELTRRGIPYHKYGGLKFLEAAHIKDALAFLRLAENPRDLVAGMRVLCLLPGIGPAKARKLLAACSVNGGRFDSWQEITPAPAVADLWPQFVQLMLYLAEGKATLPAQLHQIRVFYEPLLPVLYDNPIPRAKDLEQLEQIASRFKDRQTFLAQITLDPPNSTQDFAANPDLNDDYLVLSTIHSAKGLEWDVVFIINATDGNIPSDMATGSPESIEEERRLFYVAVTRAKRYLYVCYPQSYYTTSSLSWQNYGIALKSRFLTPEATQCFTSVTAQSMNADDTELPSLTQRKTAL